MRPSFIASAADTARTAATRLLATARMNRARIVDCDRPQTGAALLDDRLETQVSEQFPCCRSPEIRHAWPSPHGPTGVRSQGIRVSGSGPPDEKVFGLLMPAQKFESNTFAAERDGPVAASLVDSSASSSVERDVPDAFGER